MAAQIRTKLATIMPVIRTRLQDHLVFPAERVFLSKKDVHPNVVQADQYIVILLRLSGVDQPNVIGAGRVDTRLQRRFATIARTRLELDESNKDISWLDDSTYGHLTLEHNVIDALQMYQPVDSNDNWLVTEPIKALNVGAPQDLQQFEGWGMSYQEWELIYEANLTQSYQ